MEVPARSTERARSKMQDFLHFSSLAAVEQN